MADTQRYRVVFKLDGHVTWERTVIASSPRDAVGRARELALHLGVDVGGHFARVEDAPP